jgi:hypothetical protein
MPIYLTTPVEVQHGDISAVAAHYPDPPLKLRSHSPTRSFVMTAHAVAPLLLGIHAVGLAEGIQLRGRKFVGAVVHHLDQA